jgi:hypothetical protein
MDRTLSTWHLRYVVDVGSKGLPIGSPLQATCAEKSWNPMRLRLRPEGPPRNPISG